MKRVLLGAVLLFSHSIFAADLSEPYLTWTLPTEFTDNSPLYPATDLQDVKIYCSGAQEFLAIVSPTSTSYTIFSGALIIGDYSCYLTATATIFKGGLESYPSEPLYFTVSPGEPSPVLNFGVI